MSILACLAGGRANLQRSRLSPSGTDTSSQWGDPEVPTLFGTPLPLRSSLAPDSRNGSTIESHRNELQGFSEIELLVLADHNTPTDENDIYKWRRWSKNEPNSPAWTYQAIIRHSNDVEIANLRVTLPEDIQTLQSCMASCFPDLSVEDAARRLLTTMQDENLAITTSVKIAARQGNKRQKSVSAVRAFLYFRSALKPEDWRIMRQVFCIICSKKAMEKLAQMAGFPSSIEPYYNSSADTDGERLLRAMSWPEFVSGDQSAGLALTRSRLCLRAFTTSTGSSVFEWTNFPAQIDVGLTADQLRAAMSHASRSINRSTPDLLKPYITKHLRQYTVPVRNGRQILPATIKIPTFRTQGVLIKKPKEGWPHTTQDFCYLVTGENVQFDDEAKLGQLLQETKNADEVFGVIRKDHQDNSVDESFLDRWIQILKGQLPQDTTFEQNL